VSLSPDASVAQVVLAVASAYTVSPEDLEDAASEVWAAVRRSPLHKGQVAAHQAGRRSLARQLGLPQRGLPADAGRSQAICQWQRARRRCRRPDEIDAFDRHDRRFAAANGVCPRCSAPGQFTDTEGACTCGFAYGPGRRGPQNTASALETLLRDARESA